MRGVLLLGLLLLVAAPLAGCSADAAATDPAMNAPSAANGPKMSDWSSKNPDNGKGGHQGEN